MVRREKMQQIEQLLAIPTFQPSSQALADLVSGNTDKRLIFVLLTLAQKHALDVSTAGFRNDPFHNQIHVDHLHLSFEMETGTENQE